MSTQRIVTVLLVSLVGLGLIVSGAGVATAQSPPGNPAVLYGDAEDANGVPAPVGTTIYAVSDSGTVLDTVTVDDGESGVYAKFEQDDNKLEFDSTASSPIHFHLGSADGTEATGTFDNKAGAYEYNITFPAGTFDAKLTGIDLSVDGNTGSVSVTNGNTASITVTANYNNGSSVDKTDAAQLSVADTGVARVTGSNRLKAVSTGSTTLTATFTDKLGITKQDSISVDVTAQEEETDDGGTSGAGGAGGTGGTGGAGPGDGADEAPPTVAEVRNTLELVEPTTDTSIEITDATPDTPSVTVTPEGTESVSSITFNNEGVTGSVSIREFTDPPQEIRDAVAESVTAAGAADTGGDDGVTGGTVNVISVVDITPDNEAAEESSATVTLSVPRDEVNNPERVTVIKETYSEELQQDTWSQLETTLEEVGDEQVTVSAQADSFSLFAVTEVEPADDQQQDEQVNETEQPDEPADDGGPGTGLIIGLLVVIAVIGAAVYLYSQQEEE